MRIWMGFNFLQWIRLQSPDRAIPVGLFSELTIPATSKGAARRGNYFITKRRNVEDVGLNMRGGQTGF